MWKGDTQRSRLHPRRSASPGDFRGRDTNSFVVESKGLLCPDHLSRYRSTLISLKPLGVRRLCRLAKIVTRLACRMVRRVKQFKALGSRLTLSTAGFGCGSSALYRYFCRPSLSLDGGHVLSPVWIRAFKVILQIVGTWWRLDAGSCIFRCKRPVEGRIMVADVGQFQITLVR